MLAFGKLSRVLLFLLYLNVVDHTGKFQEKGNKFPTVYFEKRYIS